jgi:hypothetical protein
MPQSDYSLTFTEDADEDMFELRSDPSKKSIAKAVIKSLQFMRVNLRHPSLRTHKYEEISGPNGEEVFESYAQNNTPGAYRIFWYYSPKKKRNNHSCHNRSSRLIDQA